MCDEHLTSRIVYSKLALPLHEADLSNFILAEAAVGLGTNTVDEAALQVVSLAMQGVLRLCHTPCRAILIAACLEHQRIYTISHVNAAWQQAFGALVKPCSSGRSNRS